MSEYRIQLDVFNGPLDLLLYLVRKEEVDIYDIPIAQITAQYLAYLDMLKSLDIDVAGDFLVMAATLLEIKSAMLLPKTEPQDGETVEAIDPRSELVRQLLEYKRIKDAANLLDTSAQQRQLRFTRPASILERFRPAQEPELDLEQISIWTLLETFDQIMKSVGQINQLSQIQDDTPIDLYQIEILDRLQKDGAMPMQKIFEGKTNRLVLIGLFLALLELIRNRLVWAEQPDPLGAIFLKALTSEPAEIAVQKAILSNPAPDVATGDQLTSDSPVQSYHTNDGENAGQSFSQSSSEEYEHDEIADALKQIRELTVDTDIPDEPAANTAPCKKSQRAPVPIQSIDTAQADTRSHKAFDNRVSND